MVFVGMLSHVTRPMMVLLQSRPSTTMVPVGVLDLMGVAAVEVSADLSTSDNRWSERYATLELGADISNLEWYYIPFG